jgi:hypothetical protein
MVSRGVVVNFGIPFSLPEPEGRLGEGGARAVPDQEICHDGLVIPVLRILTCSDVGWRAQKSPMA